MISVVIPLYNKSQSIVQTLHSVLSQSFQDFELVVVDDGSTDISIAMVNTIQNNKIKLYSKPNGGVSSARNFGIEKSTFDYIAFLDADDFWEPNYLEEQAKLIRDFPEAAMWGSAWGTMILSQKNPVKQKVADDFRGIVLDYWQRELYLFWTSAVVVRKSAFKKIGYFDVRMKCGEDLDMWYRIILNYPVAYNNIPLAYYRQDAENRAMNNEIPLDKHLPYYIEKYAEYRKNNFEFRKYFDLQSLYRLFPYALENKRNPDLQRVLKQIDFSQQKWSMRYRFRFPRLYNFYSKTK
jgi:glycosyltransferase involved in cell wall biosynthesis